MVRFGFGKNWSVYEKGIDDLAISAAKTSLENKLEEDLKGKTFLDIGCGSGLFSLAAYLLGAKVTCFDYDLDSVDTANRLFSREISTTEVMTAIKGDVLDAQFMEAFPKFDFVYSWGVLHHTGDMYLAFRSTIPLVKNDGKLFIAIYNDQGLASKFWLLIKFLYCSHWLLANVIICIFSPYFYARRILRFLVKRTPLPRGMSTYYDMVDWLGGFPFEVAQPSEVVSFFESNGFRLAKSNLVGKKSGCNEFVFIKVPIYKK